MYYYTECNYFEYKSRHCMHVITHVAWCSFSSFDSFSFVLCPLSFNMFLWHLVASHSLVTLIVLLVAPTPSDALPVNVSLQFPRAEKCGDKLSQPCVCNNAYSISGTLDRKRCGPTVFKFETSEANILTEVSHRSSLVTSCTGDDNAM
jgi:hypothetical protein